jgi:hypothetical protein
MANRELDRFRDPDTGEAKMDLHQLGLDDWYKSDGSLDRDKTQDWFKEEDTGWFDSVTLGVFDKTADSPRGAFLKASERGGELEGVSIIDLMQEDAYKKFSNKITRKGKNMMRELAGAYNNVFGRNPTIREAMFFKESGVVDLESDDPSVGYQTTMNIRLIPENWIDNYNEPGQLEGIFALLNGGNVTPERQVARTSGWAKFGNLAGGILATAAGSFAGGAGAGVAAGLYPKTDKTDEGG